jgi:hypothetical protein
MSTVVLVVSVVSTQTPSSSCKSLGTEEIVPSQGVPAVEGSMRGNGEMVVMVVSW